ncbi:MarR family winged helix-turn-helix transcriptional regulator [Acidovorax sp.]|uniref:MarR family winged helix-turn-helix transcriptional regulator n=1 Tax=Acidovorax sp. TaxID=1872122 RepID=UPI002ACEE267|nr:MarR family transcriptional regulator [Acidovorax sp.]MDZ7865241.1 MarR family transcriptional regulator [Acidovorax sp.]
MSPSTSPATATIATPGSLGVLLRLLHQQFAGAVDEALAEAGFGDVRAAHASVFTFVPPEGMPVSELTRLARVRKQSMAQTVDELEKLGYVERRPSPSDKRSRLVFLTPRGQQIRPLAMAAGGRTEAQWAALVGTGELDAIKGGMAALLGRLQPGGE